MTKKSPEELKAEADEIADYIATARKRPLKFALLLASEGVVLKAHAQKDTEALWRLARSAGGMKGATGEMTVAGKLIELACTSADFPTSLPRQAKAHLKELGIAMRVQMWLPNGDVLSDGEADDAPDVPPADGVAAAPAAPGDGTAAPGGVRRAALLEQLKKLVPEVKARAEKDPAQGAKLAALLRAAQAQLAENAFEPVEKAIAAMTAVLAVPVPPPVPAAPPPRPAPTPQELDAERQRLRNEFAAQAPRARDFIKRAPPSLGGKVRQIAEAFARGIDGTDLGRMAQLVLALKNFLDAHSASLPPESLADRARDSIAAAAGRPVPASRHANAEAVKAKYPAGAAAAKAAYDSFAGVLGDSQPVTPQVLKTARDDIADAEARLAAPAERMRAAQAMPPGPARTAAVAAAKADVDAAQARVDAAVAFEKAARGKAALDEALSFGPLSADSRQTFKDGTSAKLVAAFVKDPDLATAGVKAAAKGAYPDAVADALDGVIKARQARFSDGKVAFADDRFAAEYAEKIVGMGADVGPGYFARLDAYLATGRQFVTDPLGDGAIDATQGTEKEQKDKRKKKAQMRSVALARGMLKPDGTINPDRREARQAVGDLLFNPEVLSTPMAAMNGHVLATLDMLGEPGKTADASKILTGLKPMKGSARKLVRRAVGKSQGTTVGRDDARVAIMASMLKGIDQDDVGSCFSTAPLRKLRQDDPMAVMRMYAEAATAGTVTPVNGPAVPVVTTIAPHEDPLLRTVEYSVASSMARQAKSDERHELSAMMAPGLGKVADAIESSWIKKNPVKGFFKSYLKGGASAVLQQKMADAFEHVYDPTSQVGSSADGNSSLGRFVLVKKGTTEMIKTKADFLAVLRKVAVAVSGHDDPSAAADSVRAAVDDPAMVDRFDTDGGAPWELLPGGDGVAASRTLYDAPKEKKELIAKGKGTDRAGARTAKLVTKLLEGIHGSAEDLVTVETVGKHALNALPQDPSLAKLMAGGKDRVAANVQAHLTDAGAALAATAIPVKQAQQLFDRQIAWLEKQVTRTSARNALKAGVQAHRPTAPVTPKALEDAITAATDSCLNLATAGRADPDAQKDEYKGTMTAQNRNELMLELGVPQFVIADTNWGSQDDHTYFVVAPDPVSGEPTMWIKTVPPGTLSPAGRDWVDAKWHMVR